MESPIKKILQDRHLKSSYLHDCMHGDAESTRAWRLTMHIQHGYHLQESEKECIARKLGLPIDEIFPPAGG